MTGRTKGKNFTEREKFNLLSIAKRYRTIIENKKVNGLTSKKKREAWEEIAQHFNTNTDDGLRTVQQLRILYKNLKTSIRKNPNSKKRELNTVAKAVVLNLAERQMKPLLNPYEDNAVFDNDKNYLLSKAENLKTEEKDYSNDEYENFEDPLEEEHGFIHEEREDSTPKVHENLVVETRKNLTLENKQPLPSGDLKNLAIREQEDQLPINKGVFLKEQENLFVKEELPSEESPYNEHISSSLETTNVGKVVSLSPVQNHRLKKIKRSNTTENLCRLYYRKKIGLVAVQRRAEIFKYKAMREKHELEMKQLELDVQIREKTLANLHA